MNGLNTIVVKIVADKHEIFIYLYKKSVYSALALEATQHASTLHQSTHSKPHHNSNLSYTMLHNVMLNLSIVLISNYAIISQHFLTTIHNSLVWLLSAIQPRQAQKINSRNSIAVLTSREFTTSSRPI